MTHETLMSKNVKIFQGPTDRRTNRPTDMTTPRSSDPELKNTYTLIKAASKPYLSTSFA